MLLLLVVVVVQLRPFPAAVLTEDCCQERIAGKEQGVEEEGVEKESKGRGCGGRGILYKELAVARRKLEGERSWEGC